MKLVTLVKEHYPAMRTLHRHLCEIRCGVKFLLKTDRLLIKGSYTELEAHVATMEEKLRVQIGRQEKVEYSRPTQTVEAELIRANERLINRVQAEMRTWPCVENACFVCEQMKTDKEVIRITKNHPLAGLREQILRKIPGVKTLATDCGM